MDALSNFTVTNSGNCDADDQKLIEAAGGGKMTTGTFPWFCSECGREAYSFWYNSFSYDDFYSCLKNGIKGKKLPVSRSCANCLGIPSEYGAQNCKTACMTDSCSSGCVSCVKKGNVGDKMVDCAGFKTPEREC